MADYTLLVQNKSGASRAYFLYMELPELGGLTTKLWQACYITAPPVANNTGTASFHIHKQYYAVAGTTSRPLAPEVNVGTGDFEIISVNNDDGPGSACRITVDEGGIRFLHEKTTASVSRQNSFSIQCDRSFNLPNQENYFIGLGAQNPDDPTNIIPVATIPAQPSTTTMISPKPIYYLAWGSHTAGDIIDTTTLAEPAKIDFSGKRSTKAKIVHKDDGTWSISYN